MTRKETEFFLLRIGVAFSFIYPAAAAYFDPLSWIGFFPSSLLDLAQKYDILMLHFFGATEIAIALWILIGKRIFIPSALASLYLLAIILFNLPLMDIIFRDISILLMTIALAIWSYPLKSNKKKIDWFIATC